MPIQIDNTNTGVVTLVGPASSTSSIAFPSANGTSNQVLTTDGSGNLSWVALGSPSVDGFTLTSASNSIVASGGTTNQSATLAFKGTAGFCVNLPDATATGGDARGLYSVDLQSARSSSSQVTSSQRSIILGGSSNTVSGSYGISSGYTNNAGSTSIILGGASCTVSGTYSNVIGVPAGTNTLTLSSNYATVMGASKSTSGSVTYANSAYSTILPRKRFVTPEMYGAFAANITQEVQVGGVTTSSTPKVLTTNAAAAGSYNVVGGYGFTTVIRGEIVARASSGITKAWRYYFTGTAAPVASGSITVISSDTGTSAWDVAITGSNSSLTFTATGDSSLTVRWFARVVINST